jgi:TPR repeat protein
MDFRRSLVLLCDGSSYPIPCSILRDKLHFFSENPDLLTSSEFTCQSAVTSEGFRDFCRALLGRPYSLTEYNCLALHRLSLEFGFSDLMSECASFLKQHPDLRRQSTHEALLSVQIVDLQDRLARQERELARLSEQFRCLSDSTPFSARDLSPDELTSLSEFRSYFDGRLAKAAQDLENEQFYRHGCELIFGERGYDKSQGLGVELLTVAADRGHSDAQYRVGKCCHVGIGTRKDFERASKYYRMAADQGNSWGENAYAAVLEVSGDITHAVEYYRRSAAKGNSKGQVNYGTLLESGNGVAANIEEAVRYYKLSADQENAQGLYFYGVCLEQGRFLARDDEKALQFYRRSAEQGNPFAYVRIGLCLENGIGCLPDIEKAVTYYKTAADLDNPSGMLCLGRCLEQGKGVARDFEKAAFYYQLAAMRNDDEAAYDLARCLESGRGVPQDLLKAAENFMKAADGGVVAAQLKIAKMLESGRGVPKDTERALVYYRKAAEQGNEEARKIYSKLAKIMPRRRSEG